MSIREPAVAGRFYPENKYDLANTIKDLRKSEMVNVNYNLTINHIIGGIVPHAGYAYSGFEAVHFFEILHKSKQKFDTVIILTPNHSGNGAPISLDVHEAWKTPLGKVDIDLEFQELLNFEKREEAHRVEHSGEVMLPFLQQMFKSKPKIVPISLKDQSLMSARKTAAALFEAQMKLDRKIMVIASSDFSHFVSPEEGIEKDDFALEKIAELNSEELENVVKERRISMCGCGPIMTLIEYVIITSVNPGFEMLARGNSFKKYPSVEVVDYISGLFFEKEAD